MLSVKKRRRVKKKTPGPGEGRPVCGGRKGMEGDWLCVMTVTSTKQKKQSRCAAAILCFCLFTMRRTSIFWGDSSTTVMVPLPSVRTFIVYFKSRITGEKEKREKGKKSEKDKGAVQAPRFFNQKRETSQRDTCWIGKLPSYTS